jgi:hypothetical protein
MLDHTSHLTLTLAGHRTTSMPSSDPQIGRFAPDGSQIFRSRLKLYRGIRETGSVTRRESFSERPPAGQLPYVSSIYPAG